MANEPTKGAGLFASLAQLGRSIGDLAGVFRGRDFGGAPAEDALAAAEPEAPAQRLLEAPAAHAESAQLLTQATPGWHTPQPSTLAAPSYAPAMTAFGIVFVALGAVTVWPLSVVGAVIFALAMAKWIGELLQ